jgi:TP901 family phage tail tape measure protein
VAETSIRFKVETRDANKKVAQLERQVRKLEVAVVKAGGTTRTAGSGFKAFGSSAAAASVGVKGFGAALSAALGPVTAVVAAVGSLGQVFGILKAQDFAEAKVRTLGVNSEELKGRLAGVSRELSGQASVLDLTSAAYDVASAGFNNAADASLILKAASQGATGGFSDLNTVGDATTSVLNAYGLEADKAAKLVDGFIQTQNDGKIVIGEYAANIAKVAPVAAALGVPLEEVNAAVAQITAGGEKAEVTFTALKTALSQVAAGKVGKEFEALGVEINASTLKSDGLAGTLEKIKKVGADAGTVIKAFGTEAGPAILALLNNTEKYNKLLENQKNAQGAASKAAFEASDTIEGSIKRLSTAFQNIFSDGSELGLLLKGTFQVAAVTVEVFGVAIKAAVAPLRAMIGAVSEIHSAIASALGITGVNVAFELEKAYQQVLGVFLDISNFVVGLGVQLGKFIGAQVTKALNASKDIRNGILGAFGGVFEKVAGFIRNAYNLIPEPIRKFIEGKLSGAQAFIDETVALGKGAIGGALTPDQTQQFKPQNNIISTNKDLVTSPTGKTDQEKADELAKIAEAHADRVKKMEQQTLLASALNAEETKNFQRQIAISDLLQNKNNLSDTQLKKELDILTNLHEQEDATAEIIKNKDAQTKQLEEQAAAAESLKEKYKQVGDAIKSKVTDSIIAAIDGTKSLGESAMGILKDLANQFLRSGISQLFGAVGGMGPSGGFLSMLFGGGKASGGTVKGGTSYMVGERGPELFTPGRSGSIAPNSAMGGANVTVNVDASGSKVQGNQADGKALGSAIGAAVQAELIKQKRPGGLLAG